MAGRSLLVTCSLVWSTGPSLKEFWNIQGKARGETKGKRVAIRQKLDGSGLRLAARLSIVLSTTKSMVEMFAPVVSKPLKRIQSRWPKVFERLCNLAIWSACLYLPTGVTAFELQRRDDVTGYGPAPAGVALLMFMLFFLKVYHSVQGCMNSLVDNVGRPLKKLSYMIFVTVVLAAMAIILVSAFKDVNHFEGDDSVADL